MAIFLQPGRKAALNEVAPDGKTSKIPVSVDVFTNSELDVFRSTGIVVHFREMPDASAKEQGIVDTLLWKHGILTLFQAVTA